VGGVVVVGLLVATYLSTRSRAVNVTEEDTVVVADFANSTGDSVFDGALRQGLSVQLQQSPFLRIVSDQRIRETLRLMGKPQDARLVPEIAKDLCVRIGSKAYIAGSITNLGNDYVIGLQAVNCLTGDLLAQEQVQALGKEKWVWEAVVAGGRKRKGPRRPEPGRCEAAREAGRIAQLGTEVRYTPCASDDSLTGCPPSLKHRRKDT
jgi:hypothetical protein